MQPHTLRLYFGSTQPNLFLLLKQQEHFNVPLIVNMFALLVEIGTTCTVFKYSIIRSGIERI